MKAGLLLYCSRRTSACEKVIARAAGWFGMELSGVKVCTREDGINPCVAALLRQAEIVFSVSEPEQDRPACAAPMFRTLRVPVGTDGEPVGVKKLPGRRETGYLVESRDRAIVLLPDDPCEILEMLPAAMERLQKKFSLHGSFPAPAEIDFERMAAESMGIPETEKR